jgi:Zn-dependent M28 family amino/carboxypeptidase
MKKWFLILLAFVWFNGFGQAYNSFYGSIVNNSANDTLYHHLLSLQNFGVKSYNSLALKKAANWLVSKYQSFGYLDVVKDSFLYSGNQLYNIVVTKQGTAFPNKYLIINAHYDNTFFGPGVNDNGSGVAITLEIARLLSGINTAYSIRFINFSGEEAGYKGSIDYVNTVVIPQNLDILLDFNIDEVGGKAGANNNTIKCERGNSASSIINNISANYTDTLSVLTGIYSNLLTLDTIAYGSDYMPFQSNGEIITGFYEKPESPYYHHSTDILSNMNLPYFYQVAKASIAAALYFSKAYQVIIGVSESLEDDKIKLYPNPFSGFINIDLPSMGKYHLIINDFSGKVVAEQNIIGNNRLIDLKSLNQGFYTYLIYNSSGLLVKSGKLIKIK